MLCYRRGASALALIEATILQPCLAARPIASIELFHLWGLSILRPDGDDFSPPPRAQNRTLSSPRYRHLFR
jgi:hypothetical protein